MHLFISVALLKLFNITMVECVALW